MNKLEHQDFYTFSWDSAEEDFHYSHRPGIYAWYPQTNELKHVTYVGGEASSWGFSAWVHLTDDHKYILEDFGTTPLPRTLKIWRTDTEELVYDGNYNGFVMTDHKVEVAYNYRCYYAGWGDENSQLSDELLDYGRQYLQENPPDNELIEGEHSSICLSIVCEFDMDTREEQILRGEYTPSM